ncbi:MAG: hypothetical protein LBT59_10240 [Clostridiales bacterium]|jgi:hypothetical protein|nr:hypothetical protein [Clostridiales bacterium]
MSDYWRIPSNDPSTYEIDATVACYLLPYDKRIPLICMSERPVQLLQSFSDDSGVSDPDRASEKAADDKCAIFMFMEPLTGWRKAVAKQNRSIKTYARLLLELSEEFKGCENVRLVSSTLANRGGQAFYREFWNDLDTALRLSDFYQFSSTPPDSTWLNMAENELNRMCWECLRDLKDPTLAELNERIAAWTEKRQKLKVIKWQYKVSSLTKRLHPERR